MRKNTTANLHKLPASAPWSWLKNGAQDIKNSRGLSLLYGVCFVLMGLGIDRAHADNPIIALGLSAGFLFVGPFLALGLYELSRQYQAGERVDLILSLFSWCRNPASVGRYALFLSVVMLAWLWLSVTLKDVVAAGPSLSLIGFLMIWAALAILVYMCSVVAIPMLLGQPVKALFAMVTSVRCCRVSPGAFSLWALIIALLVVLSIALGYWPLFLVGPVLGHATWHAYHASLSVDSIRES